MNTVENVVSTVDYENMLSSSYVGGLFVRSKNRFLSVFLSSGTVRFSVILLGLIVISSLLAPFLTPYGGDDMDLNAILTGPSVEHVLGTDELGRDLFSRLLYGGRFSLAIALGAVMIALLVGIFLGTVAGYFGGLVDRFVSMITDLFLSVPAFLVLLLVCSLVADKVWLIPVVIGSMSWMEVARIVRAEFLSLKEREFVDAARSMGASDSVVMLKHILPLAMGPVIVSATAGFAQAMLVESALSFLGFGVQPPIPTWGNMLRNAQTFLHSSPMVAFAPGFLIFITCLCVNFIGEGISKAFGTRGAR